MRSNLAIMALVMASWVIGAEKAETVPVNEWHGVVGCAKCDHAGDQQECLPSIKTGTGLFLLKAGPSSPPAVKDFLERIRTGDMKGAYLIHGEPAESDGRKWVVASTMVAKPLPVKEEGSLSYTRPKPAGSGATTGTGKGDAGTDPAASGGGGGRGRRGHQRGGDGAVPEKD